MTGLAVYPGSFNPPTIAHLAVAVAAADVGFARVELVVSEHALAKPVIERPTLEDRLAVIDASLQLDDRLGVRRTTDRLLADIARGADALVVGMDKWVQIHEAQWYADDDARDTAIRSLPTILLVARDDQAPPAPVAGGPEVVRLDVEPHLVEGISSSAVRGGRIDWMTPTARAFAETHGVWGTGAGS